MNTALIEALIGAFIGGTITIIGCLISRKCKNK